MLKIKYLLKSLNLMDNRGTKGKEQPNYPNNRKQRQNNLTGRFEHCMLVTPSLSRSAGHLPHLSTSLEVA